ncbi:MAG: Vps62-related protein, partial [Bacteroidota bacterium]
MKLSINLYTLFCFIGIASFFPHLQAQRTLKTDELEIMFVTNFTAGYADHGTGANSDLSTWKPVLPPGFSSLGHYAKAGYGAPQTVMIAVRGIDPTALAFPTGYKRTYHDSGTGGHQDGSFWLPIAPAGYRALGMVAMQSHGQPPLNEVVCVREDLTTYASIGAFIWNDAGSGGDLDASVWQIKPPSISQNSKVSYITSGSFYGYATHATPTSAEVAYAIKVKMPSENKNLKPEKPRLTSADKPVEKTQMKLASVAYLPCISVQDRVFASDVARQVRETPIYTLERYDYYYLQDFNTSYSDNDGSMSFSYTTGMTKSHEKSITETFSTESTAGTSFYGVDISVTVSYALDQTNTYSTEDMTERTLEKQFTVPGNGAGALYTLSHLYKLKRANGEVIDTWEMHSKFAHFTDFAPEKKQKPVVNQSPPPINSTNNVQTNNRLPVSMNMLRSNYQTDEYLNEWQGGYIEGQNMRWTNNAGASWTLNPNPIKVSNTEIVFETDRDNPYYDQGYTTFSFLIQNGQVMGFNFANSFYRNISE